MPLLRGACAWLGVLAPLRLPRARGQRQLALARRRPSSTSVPRPVMPRMTEIAGQRIPLLDEDRQSIIVTIGERGLSHQRVVAAE